MVADVPSVPPVLCRCGCLRGGEGAPRRLQEQRQATQVGGPPSSGYPPPHLGRRFNSRQAAAALAWRGAYAPLSLGVTSLL